MHNVVLMEKELKNYNEFFFPSVTLSQEYFDVFCQVPGYFLRKTSVKCFILVLLSLNLNLNHVRLHDVESWCFSANRGSYGSSAGLLLNQNVSVGK